MRNPLGFGVAFLATAGFAIAGGEGDKKGKEGDKKGPKKEASQPLDGWSGGPGKGLTYSSDMFQLTLRALGQVSLSYHDNNGRISNTPATLGRGVRAGDEASFDVPRARTMLSGHIWNKDVTYRLENEWTEDTSVKEFWLDWRFKDTEKYDMGLRIGQQKIGFGHEWMAFRGDLEFVDRSIATRVFSNVRSRGATLHGDMAVGGEGGALGWSFSAFNTDIAAAGRGAGEDGDPRSPTALAGADFNDEGDDRFNWHAGVTWSNRGKASMGAARGDLDHDGNHAFGAGLSYYHANGRRAPFGAASPLPAGTLSAEVETDSGNLWGAWHSGNGIAVAAEYFVRAESAVGTNAAVLGGGTSDSNGFTISGSWVAAPVEGQNQWGFGLRFSEVHLEDTQLMLTGAPLQGAGGGVIDELEAVVNCYYHDHDMKTQIGVTWQAIDAGVTAAAGTTQRNSIDNILVTIQTTFTF